MFALRLVLTLCLPSLKSTALTIGKKHHSTNTPPPYTWTYGLPQFSPFPPPSFFHIVIWEGSLIVNYWYMGFYLAYPPSPFLFRLTLRPHTPNPFIHIHSLKYAPLTLLSVTIILPDDEGGSHLWHANAERQRVKFLTSPGTPLYRVEIEQTRVFHYISPC